MIKITSEKDNIDIETMRSKLEESVSAINDDPNKSDVEKAKETSKLYRKFAKETQTVLKIELDLKLSANANAEAYYQKRKAAAIKLEKTLKASKLAEEQAKLKGIRVAKKALPFVLFSFTCLVVCLFVCLFAEFLSHFPFYSLPFAFKF